MSQFQRDFSYLTRHKIIYRRDPVNDIPSEVYKWGEYYEEGTYECYDLFRSKAKINTFKSLKWHLLVLWYLNPNLDPDSFLKLAKMLSNKKYGFVTFNVYDDTLNKIVYDVFMSDLEEPPRNKLRKVIFKDGCNLTVTEKLKIVGSFFGRKKSVTHSDIYETMLYIHDLDEKITISKIAKSLNVSSRTINRSLTEELKREKELLNKELKKCQTKIIE